MTEQEIQFLTKQSIERAGFEPELIDATTTIFINLHRTELTKIDYSQAGLETLSSCVEAWKRTDTGKRFLPRDTPKTKETLKEIVSKVKSGKLKFKGHYS